MVKVRDKKWRKKDKEKNEFTKLQKLSYFIDLPNDIST